MNYSIGRALRPGAMRVIPKRFASTRQRRSPEFVMPVEPQEPPKKAPAGAIPPFLKDYSTRDLMCYSALTFVTSQGWLLKLATKLLPYTPTPIIRALVSPIYSGGETLEDVRKTGLKLWNRGIGNMMLSYAVEDANGTLGGAAMAQSVQQIKKSIVEVFVKNNKIISDMYARGEVTVPPTSGYIALKPTGLMEGSADILANYNNPAYAERYAKYLDVCRSICQDAKDRGKGSVVIVFDAEKDWLQQGVYDAQRQMMREFNRNGDVLVAGTVQMYLQKSLSFLQSELERATQDGYQVAMKLVRGAYIHSEKDRWNVIHRTKEDTDRSFNAGTSLMLDHLMADWRASTRTGPVGRLIVASHNIESCDAVAARIEREAPAGLDRAKNEDVVFGQLMGMNDDQSKDLSMRGFKVVKYVPWGPAKETKEYLTRRLEENGDAARGGWEHFVGTLREMRTRVIG